jgi:hypothetical protein
MSMLDPQPSTLSQGLRVGGQPLTLNPHYILVYNTILYEANAFPSERKNGHRRVYIAILTILDPQGGMTRGISVKFHPFTSKRERTTGGANEGQGSRSTGIKVLTLRIHACGSELAVRVETLARTLAQRTPVLGQRTFELAANGNIPKKTPTGDTLFLGKFKLASPDNEPTQENIPAQRTPILGETELASPDEHHRQASTPTQRTPFLDNPVLALPEKPEIQGKITAKRTPFLDNFGIELSDKLGKQEKTFKNNHLGLREILNELAAKACLLK